MPAAKPPEFRRRAVELARAGDQPVAKIASDLGISESCLRRWMAVDDIDAGRREGLSSGERKELVELRRRTRVQAMEIEILKRASAYLTESSRSEVGAHYAQQEVRGVDELARITVYWGDIEGLYILEAESTTGAGWDWRCN